MILGNHRDAWVYGAADPNSGTASLLEVARGLGSLLKVGWQPLRSLVLCSWSGEEYGLLGSTAWGEIHADELANAYAYINVDTAVSGDALNAGGTFALRDAFADVLRVVNGTDVKPLSDSWSGEWGVLGSGSDYTVFLDHLGVASVDFAFERRGVDGKLAMYGQYHSVYDSFDWVDHFAGGAPGMAFEYLKIMAQVWGVLALRLADNPRVAFNHTRQAEGMEQWLIALSTAANASLDLTSLKSSICAYKEAAQAIEGEAQNEPGAGLNDRLALTERRFLASDGLPGLKWFRHVLQAPGRELGYGALAFPGIAEPLLAGDLKLAEEQAALAALRIQEAAVFLKGSVSLSQVEILV